VTVSGPADARRVRALVCGPYAYLSVHWQISQMAPRRILSKRPLPLGWGLMVADYCEEEMNASAVLGSLFGSASFSATIIPVPQLLEVIRILAYNFPWKEKVCPQRLWQHPSWRPSARVHPAGLRFSAPRSLGILSTAETCTHCSCS